MPTTPDPLQWRAFNVLLRLLGIGATFSGIIAFVTVGLGLPPVSGGEPARSTAGLVSGGLVTLLGLGFLMLKPFRPDLGDTGLPLNPFRPVPAPRRWWTGDPA
jgi:hypothetical protein